MLQYRIGVLPWVGKFLRYSSLLEATLRSVVQCRRSGIMVSLCMDGEGIVMLK